MMAPPTPMIGSPIIAATRPAPSRSIVASISARRKSVGSSPPNSSARYGHAGVRCSTCGRNVPAGEDPGAVRLAALEVVEPRGLHRALVALRAAVREEDAVEPVGGEIGKP